MTQDNDRRAYAIEQFDLGVSFNEAGDIDQARVHWGNITRADDKLRYARAQLVLGVSCYEEGNIDQARKYWGNITRDDDKEVYAQAQFFLGNSFNQEGDLEQARAYWKQVSREDDKEAYTQAQFNLGVSFNEQGDLEQVQAHWGNITRADDKEVYAQAQFNLGVSCYKEGNIDQARAHWGNITREDDKETYVKAQLLLGNSCYEEGNIDQARKYWGNITREDDKETYVNAQLLLGNSFVKEGNIDQAQKYWGNITGDDDKEVYAQVQFALGNSFNQEGDLEQARAYWKQVSREDDKEAYTQAQFNLGVSCYKEGNIDQARVHWDNVINCSCQFKAGQYQVDLSIYIMQRVIQFVLKNDKHDHKGIVSDIYGSLIDIQGFVDIIVTLLHMKPDPAKTDQQSEQQFAHYTSVEVAHKLIQQGSFHLGVANHMNDPLEGKILSQAWQFPIDYHDDVMTFLTCFTLNENSLNQFRLYGKKDHQDGTGVSLVMAHDFFSHQDISANPLMINMGSVLGDKMQVDNIMSTKNNMDYLQNHSKDRKDKETEQFPEKLPLFRCIYMHPQTDYLNIAQRSELSFYLDKENEKPEETWKSYINDIDEITKKIKEQFEKIKSTIGEIKEIIDQKDMTGQHEINEAIATILLPIIYLTKHAAFEEEAECRILYMTSIADKKIKQDNDRVYVEYKTDVTAHNYLKKIYLGPKIDPRVEINLKKRWVDRMDKDHKSQNINIPIIKKSDMPLA